MGIIIIDIFTELAEFVYCVEGSFRLQRGRKFEDTQLKDAISNKEYRRVCGHC